MKKYADIHCHPTLFPFSRKRGGGNASESNIWYQNKTKISKRSTILPRFSQTDFTSLFKGKVKIVFAALYPIEQNWFLPSNSKKLISRLGQYVTHFSKHRISQIQSSHYNYFDELMYEYYFLLSQIKKEKEIKTNNGEKKKLRAVIPKTAEELKIFLKDENNLIIIPTIEGAASLIDGNYSDIDNFDINSLLADIKTVKKLEFTPFYITFAHHFYNGLCGHSKSLNANQKRQNFIFNIVNQDYKIDEGFNGKGLEAVKCLLSIEEYSNCGKRILIDAKHMSIKSRKTLYEIIEKHNKNHPEDIIPIIHSHTAYSGFPTMDSLEKVNKLAPKLYSDSYLFNPSSINITDEEVKIIFESQGLIGITLEEKIISGRGIIENSKKYLYDKENDLLRLFWAKQILRNIVSMVYSLINNSEIKDKERIWNIFAIGSDFDGFIDPVDAFITSEEFPELEKSLIKALKNRKDLKKISFGMNAEQIVEKIMYKNAYNFLLKNLNKESV